MGAFLSSRILQFDNFELDLGRRLLLDNGQPLRLGGRALDILIALTSRPGETVTKDELIAQVWPNTYVEEINLRVHVASLRKALGDGQSGNRFVTNIAGRGYAFVGTIRHKDTSEEVSKGKVMAQFSSAPQLAYNLPPLRGRVLGRGDAVDALATQLSEHGFITIVGPGGIGKTTVAVAVGHRLTGQYEHGVGFIDLAPITDAGLVSTAVATSLGLAVVAETSTDDAQSVRFAHSG